MILVFSLIFVFLLGLKHAFEADHLIVVSTMGNKTKTGLFWGIGHMLTLLIVVIIVSLLSLRIPENVFLYFEFVVGIIIIFFATSLLLSHKHPHTHEENKHSHYHSHIIFKSHGKSFLTGIVHGMAGSGAVIALISSTISSLFTSIIYVVIFGLGLIFGMTLFSYSFNKLNNFISENKIRISVGVLGIIYGFYYSISSLI